MGEGGCDMSEVRLKVERQRRKQYTTDSDRDSEQAGWGWTTGVSCSVLGRAV
jgi:hypothetical protein